MEIPNPDSQSLPPGAQLEEFLIERVLGSGGFGITYLARDTSLGRQVVIKENLPSQFAWRETATGTVRPRHSTGGDADDYEWSMRNFLKEAETLASLDHPGIVRVLRKFETNGTAYFVMPFVEGFAFDTLIDSRSAKGQAFSEEELGGLIHRMLSALGYLHERGIYHRDIKPANILITMEGVPVLIDFGSARQRLSERSMTVIESAGYTPFEQLQSRGNVGPWSDLYALGGTLVKALTGEAPPKANDRAFDDPFVPLADRPELRAAYSSSFLHCLDRALAMKPADRWQDAREWVAAQREPTAPSTASVPLPPASVPRPEAPLVSVPSAPQPVAASEKKRNPLPWIIGACVVLGLGLWAMIGSNKKVDGADAQRERAAEFRKAAEAGNARGMNNLGSCYENGSGVTKDQAEAVKWYRKAAEAGDAYGMTNLGFCYANGTGVTKDEAEAVKWFRKAAEAGNARGMNNLGSCYENGSGVTKDQAEAVKWYRKAAEAGDAYGMTNLGFCYFNGTGVTKDEAEAVKWLRKAAEAGDARGMTSLGHCYFNGTGVTKNETEAVKWYRKAAEAGDADGMTSLGVCYENGTGVTTDQAEAVKWYRKAAEAGDARGMINLGLCYERGTGVTKDETEAVKWYRKAAEAGDARGMTSLGRCYFNGTGVTKNETEAVKWYRKAAEAGDADGMTSLGVCYENGTGVTTDQAEAVTWYRKAAEAGNARGMANLGSCYEYGSGVTKDEAEAVKWYRKALNAGDEQAAKFAAAALQRLGK